MESHGHHLVNINRLRGSVVVIATCAVKIWEESVTQDHQRPDIVVPARDKGQHADCCDRW